MTHMFVPLLPREDLRPPVLALAAHPDDEVIGCGGMLAWHSRQGHKVTVVHMTDGAKGDPEGKFDDIPEQAFLYVGKLDEAREKAEKMKAEAVA